MDDLLIPAEEFEGDKEVMAIAAAIKKGITDRYVGKLSDDVALAQLLVFECAYAMYKAAAEAVAGMAADDLGASDDDDDDNDDESSVGSSDDSDAASLSTDDVEPDPRRSFDLLKKKGLLTARSAIDSAVKKHYNPARGAAAPPARPAACAAEGRPCQAQAGQAEADGEDGAAESQA